MKTNGNTSYQDHTLPLDQRVDNLLGQLTLDEKIQQMIHEAPAIERLNIGPMSWWNEGLHGVARAGLATVFPQAIALAASFDTDLVQKIADAVSTEARAKYKLFQKAGIHGKYVGLTFWTPNINIFRDPRWGRGQETYGEDPYLTGEIGLAFVRGLQGDNSRYLKTAACAKHFAVHSGPENLRHSFNALVSPRDLEDTYLPAFKKLVQEGGVESVMGAYNRVNGEPACGSEFLLKTTLREAWGFQGHVVSDCWAIKDFHTGHFVTKTPEESAALGVKMGCDLNCGSTYPSLVDALVQGLLTEEDIDRSVRRLLRTRFRLGEFDPPGQNPYEDIDPGLVHSPVHISLAKEAAISSLVLLKNDGTLPLQKNELKSLYITGPNAFSAEALLGNYYGLGGRLVTYGEGIVEAAGPGVQIDYRQGALLAHDKTNPIDWAVYESKSFDFTLACMGLTNLIEGEEGDAIASPDMGDVPSMKLPQGQRDFLDKLFTMGKPVILVITAGCPLIFEDYLDKAAAVIYSLYPGEQGGTALAELIFGDRDFSGKIPFTFPRSLADLPEFTDYSMEGRTYRYLKTEPFLPFGFGLSYYPLEVVDVSSGSGDKPGVRVEVKNPHAKPTSDVVQVYGTKHPEAKTAGLIPNRELIGFQKISLSPGETRIVDFELPLQATTLVLDDGKRVPFRGRLEISAGMNQPDARSQKLGGQPGQSCSIELR